MSIGSTRISNVGVVNVADVESRKVVPVTTSMKDKHVCLPKPQSQPAQLHDDEEDIFATGLIDRYTARPVSLQNICLAIFEATYDVI